MVGLATSMGRSDNVEDQCANVEGKPTNIHEHRRNVEGQAASVERQPNSAEGTAANVEGRVNSDDVCHNNEVILSFRPPRRTRVAAGVLTRVHHPFVGKVDMNQHQQRTLDSLRRVQDFLDTHADVVGPLKDSEGRKQLDDAVTQLAAHSNDQGSADLAMAGQISREKSLVTDLKTEHMQPIATFARAKLRGAPDFAALTKSAAKLKGKALVRAARAMATAAAPNADTLTQGGFPADTVTQLGDAATAVDGALTDRANTKVHRVGATKGISEQALRGREAVTMLNAVISKQFVRDKTFLAGWRTARRIVAKPGVARVAVAPLVAVAPVATTAKTVPVATSEPVSSTGGVTPAR